MTCPKCEEGEIVKIRFKRSERVAYLCDFCQALWFEGEEINFATGHTLDSYREGGDVDYTLDEVQEKDQNHQPVDYKNYR